MKMREIVPSFINRDEGREAGGRGAEGERGA